MEKYDYLIVGSGLFGATFAYRAHAAGKRCLVLERRSHTGGNIYCERIENITVHKYGAHIFHTDNREVWNFVRQFVDFNRYTNSPLANYRGEIYNLPFNMNTFRQMWGVTTPQQARQKIDGQRREAAALLQGREPANLEEQALALVGRDIYCRFVKEYTEKQWGRPCTQLPAFIIKRLPVRLVYDNNYFNDRYQGIPIGGYNRLTNGLLQGVEVLADTDFFSSPYHDWRRYARRLVYTGPLDLYFDYRLGRLEWRSVRFATRIENVSNFQGNAVVNYTSHQQPYTRVIEHKHFETFGAAVYDNPLTVVSEEYSAEYAPGMEPYYPVNDARNNRLAGQYREMARNERDVVFGGRLAQYKYYDMAPVIEEVLKHKLQ